MRRSDRHCSGSSTPLLKQKRIRNRRALGSGNGIMHAQDVTSRKDCSNMGGLRGVEHGERIGRIAAAQCRGQSLAEKALAGDAGQKRPFQLCKIRERCEELEVLRASLPEAKARVKNDAIPGYAGGLRQGEPVAELCQHQAADLCGWQTWQRAPGLRCAPRVHQHQAARSLRKQRGHPGIPLETTDIVEDLRTGVERVPCRGGMVGVDRKNGFGAFAAKSFENGKQAFLLLVRPQRCGTRPGGFSANIQDFGRSIDQLQTPLDRAVNFEKLSPIGEGVGGDVEDGHQTGALPEWQHARAQSPEKSPPESKGHGQILRSRPVAPMNLASARLRNMRGRTSVWVRLSRVLFLAAVALAGTTPVAWPQVQATESVSPSQIGALQAKIEAILSAAPVRRAHWGLAVATMDGTQLLEHGADQLFPPASTAKLFTTTAAMALLGSGSTVETKLIARGTLLGSDQLRGDLVLLGAGDSTLSGRVLPYVSRAKNNPVESQPVAAADPLRYLAAMADEVAASGLRVVSGDVLGDATLFPKEPYAEGWEQDDLVWGYGAPVSALSVADNQLRLTVTPGARAGEPASVVLGQAVPFYVVESTVRTAAPRSAHGGVQVERAPGSRTLRVYGEIAAGASPDGEEVAISDPAEYAAMALKAMLEERGVEVRGRAFALHRPAEAAEGFLSRSRAPLPGLAGAAGDSVSQVPCLHCNSEKRSAAGKVLARHVSPPLSEDVVLTNKVSENLHAELMLHRLGATVIGDGSAAGGARVVRQFLLNAGLAGDEFVFYDGSGLSGHDLVTPQATVKLLHFASTQPWFAAWRTSLPVAGEDGTLAGRFTNSPVRGRLFAKTGTLGEARALAGYLECASGRTVILSILDANHTPGSHADRAAMDHIVEAIAEAL